MVDLMVSEQQSGTAGKGVPAGWIQCKLGDVLTLQRGFDLPQRLRKEGNIPIISSSGESGWHDNAIVSPPGVVTGRYGTIGEVFFIDRPFWPLNTTLYVREFNGITPFYAYFLLKTVDFQSHSGKSGVPGVNRNDVHQENILLPPIKEQIAITTTLSNIDELISALERLLSKKQAIKTATMQQLLTGKTRLPQFAMWEDGTTKGYKKSELGDIPEDWEISKIGELSHVDPENIPSSTSPTYEFDYISLEQIDRGVLLETTRLFFSDAPSRARRLLRCNDVMVSTVRPNLKSHYLVAHEVSDLICSTGFSVIRCDMDQLHPNFLYQHLFAASINEQIDMLISGSNYPAINSDNVKGLMVPICSVPEQTAIATILSDMDKDIQTLQQRLDKTRQLKQGMMQELLTGKTRLI
ncbi:TPA: restriction endonuclease subunit S [Klebsiella oxytoca]|nr:restriction endonuclease subunit S [Klebsiella oxytoca]HED2703799.1 restriction endonuclease subunit S [Klebsiella oxytoca]